MTYKIRTSTLPMYNDCPRRSVAAILRELITDMGYELREKSPQVSTVIGTGLHSGIGHILKNRHILT